MGQYTFVTLDRRLRAIVVYDSVMYNQGHNVRRWAEALERRFTMNARALAPVNKRPKGPGKRPPGALKASIRGGVERTGPRHLRTTITIGVDYAQFVVRGTDGPIFGHGPKGMKIYYMQIDAPKPGKGVHVNRFAVKGQSANNFLDRASALTALRHPSIRGYEPTGIGL
jgi:hypothetical protein